MFTGFTLTAATPATLRNIETNVPSGVHYTLTIAPVQQNLLVEALDLQITRPEGSREAPWSVSSAFIDSSKLDTHRDEFFVLLDTAEVGGMVLSVGVVWWASRVTGMIGSLLASMPAWRQLDPLLVVNREEDEPEADWNESIDLESYADELAVSSVLGSGSSSAAVAA
jgi:hypothetical protein